MGNCKSKAFTLIELLVVIAIISLLVSILLPSLNKAKDLARRVICLSNERSLGMAFIFYYDELETLPGMHPVAFWWTDLSPYAEGSYELLHCPVLADTVDGHPLRGRYGYSQIVAYTAFIDRKLDNVPNPTETCLLVDNYPGVGTSWYGVDRSFPIGPGDSRFFPAFRHGDGTNMLFCDGHAEWMPDDDRMYMPEDCTTNEYHFAYHKGTHWWP